MLFCPEEGYERRTYQEVIVKIQPSMLTSFEHPLWEDFFLLVWNIADGMDIMMSFALEYVTCSNRHSGKRSASRIRFWTRWVPDSNPSSQNDTGKIKLRISWSWWMNLPINIDFLILPSLRLQLIDKLKSYINIIDVSNHLTNSFWVVKYALIRLRGIPQPLGCGM